MRRRFAAGASVLITLLLLLTSCGGQSSTTSNRAPRTEPETVSTLLRVAREFNADYAANRDAAVYSRWDPRSRSIISRAAYVRRHRVCDTGSGPGFVRDAVHRGRWWLVHYSISGFNLTDYWTYQHGRWVFDLFRSNPQAVHLYRLGDAAYRRAVGCNGQA